MNTVDSVNSGRIIINLARFASNYTTLRNVLGLATDKK